MTTPIEHFCYFFSHSHFSVHWTFLRCLNTVWCMLSFLDSCPIYFCHLCLVPQCLTPQHLTPQCLTPQCLTYVIVGLNWARLSVKQVSLPVPIMHTLLLYSHTPPHTHTCSCSSSDSCYCGVSSLCSSVCVCEPSSSPTAGPSPWPCLSLHHVRGELL